MEHPSKPGVRSCVDNHKSPGNKNTLARTIIRGWERQASD